MARHSLRDWPGSAPGLGTGRATVTNGHSEFGQMFPLVLTAAAADGLRWQQTAVVLGVQLDSNLKADAAAI